MSIEAMTWVFKNSPYTLAGRLVHLAIADVVNDDYESRVFIGDAKVATKAGVSRGTVVRIKAQMVKDGYLVPLNVKPAPGRYAEYRFVMFGGVQWGPVGDVSQNGTRQETCASEDANVRDPRRQRARSTKPVLLPTQEELKGTEVRAISDDPLLGFQHFWDIYPKRNGKRLGRRICEGIWKRLPLEERRAAYRGAGYYAAAIEADLTIAKDPERFLKHRCWEDWQEGAQAGIPRRRSAQNDHDSRSTTELMEDILRAEAKERE